MGLPLDNIIHTHVFRASMDLPSLGYQGIKKLVAALPES